MRKHEGGGIKGRVEVNAIKCEDGYVLLAHCNTQYFFLETHYFLSL